jgi:hypothetical protein
LVNAGHVNFDRDSQNFVDLPIPHPWVLDLCQQRLLAVRPTGRVWKSAPQFIERVDAPENVPGVA